LTVILELTHYSYVLIKAFIGFACPCEGLLEMAIPVGGGNSSKLGRRREQIVWRYTSLRLKSCYPIAEGAKS
jgi:hypothetical protein